MTPMTISWIVFACVFAGALLGIVLRRILPTHHLSEDSKDVVKLGMGLIATMAALVLALLIASAKSSHDTQSTEVTEMSADFMLLDRTLARYGPETKDMRGLIPVTIATFSIRPGWGTHIDPRTWTARLAPPLSPFMKKCGT